MTFLPIELPDGKTKTIGRMIQYFMAGILALVILGSLVHPATAADLIPFNETISGDRNMGQNFSWTVHNASGLADSIYHYTVYDYRMIGDHYEYWSVNWGQWFRQDAEAGKEFIAVWVSGWMEGTTWYGWGQDHFLIYIGNKSFKAEPVLMQDIPIRNLRASGYDSGSFKEPTCQVTQSQVISYGYSKAPISEGSRYLPVVIRDLENLKESRGRGQLKTEPYGWKDEIEMTRMEPGQSNAFSGYIIFQIPKDTRPGDIRVAGVFSFWGTALWNLVDKEIIQNSAERVMHMESVLMDIQRETGIRLPDKQAERTEA